MIFGVNNFLQVMFLQNLERVDEICIVSFFLIFRRVIEIRVDIGGFGRSKFKILEGLFGGLIFGDLNFV